MPAYGGVSSPTINPVKFVPGDGHIKKMFKKHYFKCVLAVLAAAGVSLSTSCNDDPNTPPEPKPEPTKEPRVELVAGAATTTTLTFVASSWDAEKCAYTVLPADQKAPTADEILQEGGGISFQPNKSVSITVPELTPASSYHIFAAASNGTVLSPVFRLAMITLDEGENPYTKLNITNAYYLGDTDGAGNWLLKFATDKDALGKYTDVYFDIWSSEIPENPSFPELPTGTFKASTDRTAGTFDPDGSFQRLQPDQTITTFVAGQIEITKEGSTYTIKGELNDDKGFTHLFRYEGSVVGEDQSPHHLPRISEDVEVVFTRAEGTFFGDNYKNGTSLIPIAFTDGYTVISAEFVSKATEYSLTALAPGTYTINDNRAEMTLAPGVEFNYGGWEYRPMGTYCQKGDPASYAFVTGGTVEVHVSGPSYTITFDLQTAEQISVQGSYSGTLSLNDGTEKPVVSELTEDRVVDLSRISQGVMEYYGPGWPYYNGLDMWSLEFKDESIDGIDGIQFELFLEPTGFLPNGVPTGTYEISHTTAANTLVPGFINSYLAGSWYIWDNLNGSYGKKAPINAGTLTISREGSIWTFEFSLKDDARPAHNITGSWSGKMKIF